MSGFARSVIVGVSVASIGFLASCVEPEIDGCPCDGSIVVDGITADWVGYNVLENSENRSQIGVCHDRRFLYIFVSTWHEQLQRRMLTGGFTIWLDDEGGKERRFGVRIKTDRDGLEIPADGPAARGDRIDPIGFMVSSGKRSVSIVGPGMEERFTGEPSELAVMGFELCIGHRNRILTAELKIPMDCEIAGLRLARPENRRFGIGIFLDEVESGERMPGGRPPGGGLLPGRGRPGGGEPGRGGGPGDPGRGDPFRPAKLDLWLTAFLSDRCGRED